jgi:hypothetical protein
MDTDQTNYLRIPKLRDSLIFNVKIGKLEFKRVVL